MKSNVRKLVTSFKDLVRLTGPGRKERFVRAFGLDRYRRLRRRAAIEFVALLLALGEEI